MGRWLQRSAKEQKVVCRRAYPHRVVGRRGCGARWWLAAVVNDSSWKQWIRCVCIRQSRHVVGVSGCVGPDRGAHAGSRECDLFEGNWPFWASKGLTIISMLALSSSVWSGNASDGLRVRSGPPGSRLYAVHSTGSPRDLGSTATVSSIPRVSNESMTQRRKPRDASVVKGTV